MVNLYTKILLSAIRVSAQPVMMTNNAAQVHSRLKPQSGAIWYQPIEEMSAQVTGGPATSGQGQFVPPEFFVVYQFSFPLFFRGSVVKKTGDVCFSWIELDCRNASRWPNLGSLNLLGWGVLNTLPSHHTIRPRMLLWGYKLVELNHIVARSAHNPVRYECIKQI